MIDFGLKPCPMCGGDAEVAMLSQNIEELKAIIRCTGCGLTLEWDTEFRVHTSRSGIKVAEKLGLDPIEAWNRRTGGNDCENCGAKLHTEAIAKLPSCNDCAKNRSCEYMPMTGGWCRINCPLWQPREA